MWILPVNATYAFHSMFESQGELRAYANLFVLDPAREGELQNPNNAAYQIREMWTRGSVVAARLGIVYLAAIMEAYATDVVFELLGKRIIRVNTELLDQPAPTDLDEGILNEIQLEEAELNRENPFYLFAEIATEHIENRRGQQTLKSMIGILEKYFRVDIQERDTHLRNWADLQKLRKQIVHHRASSRKTSNPIIIRDETLTLDEIVVDKDALLKNIDLMYTFAVAVEEAINSLTLNTDWRDIN
ncbi:MAG: hypothetical protein AABN95_26165 [Acidobacteriota bacterium]